MLAFQKASRFLMARLRSQVWQPRANIVAKPAKDPLSPAEHAFALSVYFTVFLTPACWFLYYLEDYKNASRD